MTLTFDPPPPEVDEVQERLAFRVQWLFEYAHAQWERKKDLRRTGVPILLARGFAALDPDDYNPGAPDPDAVRKGLQEPLPRNVVLRVSPYVPGTKGQEATLTWRE